MLPEAEQAAALAALSDKQAAQLEYDWRFWGRPEQFAPEGDWKTWAIIAGRGFGKTEAGAQWIRERVAEGARSIALIAETQKDLEEVMAARLVSIYPPKEAPSIRFKPVRLTWPNGAVALGYVGTEPNQLRGPEFDTAWIDELAKYRYAQEVWDMLQFGLRRSARPRQLITTTPRPIPLLKKVMADPTTTVTRGSTFDNAANLPSSFIDGIKTRYEGTRLGRQELNAEILDDVPGALWTRAMIDAARKPVPLPDMARVVVAIDPSGTRGTGDNGDLVGIIVAGKGVDGRFYLLADRSCKLSPAAWGRRAVDAYREFKADRVVAERNFGGAMVEHVIRTVDESVSYLEVTASRGKVQRAEPVAALYEQGRASHVAADPNELTLVEDQLCQFAPDGYVGEGSPDRADALVWAATDLMLGFQQTVPIVIPYVHGVRRTFP